MLRPLRALLALALAAFTLTGCVKIDIELSVDGGRDTVNGALIFAIDKQVLALSGKTPEESFKETEEDLAKLPKGSRSEVYDDGRFYGRKIIFEDVPLAELNASRDAPRIVHEGGKYIFTMDADMSTRSDFPGAEQILATIEMKVAVTFPGKVIERDDRSTLDGQTVSWTLKLNENHQLRAVSEEPERFPWLLLGIVAGLFGLLVVAGIVVLILRVNRRPQEPALVAPDPAASQTLVD